MGIKTNANETTLSKVFFSEERINTVKKIAYNIYTYYGCHHELEELIQWGILGLAEAYETYEDGHGTQFMTFAGHRIKGAILDGVRKMSPIPHQAYNSHASDDAKNDLLYFTSRISIDDVDSFIDLATPESSNPEVICFKNKIMSDIISSCCLTDMERHVVELYFIRDVKLKDIAQSNQVSEVRISQIKNSAIKKLKETYEREGQ